MDNINYAVLAKTLDGEIRADGWEYVGEQRYRRIFYESYDKAAAPAIVHIELSQPMPLEKLAAFEDAINARSENLGSNIRYRILPYGMKRVEDKSTPEKVILRCGYCGQWGAIYQACVHCGAPIGVPTIL